MANAWENPDMIAAEALVHMETALVIADLCATDKTADFLVRPNGYAVGDTVKIKTRPEYTVEDFTTDIVEQDIRESVRQMQIEKHFDVSVKVTAKEKALNVDDFSSQVIQPAMYALAEKIDQHIGTKIVQGAGLYASDVLFGTQADMAQARRAANLQYLGADRLCLVDDTLEASLLGKDYFATWEKRGDEGAGVFNAGSMGRAMNMNFYSSLNFPDDTHAAAGNGTSTTDNTAGTFNAIGTSTLQIDALTGQIEAGDRIAIAGVKRPLIASAQAVATATTVSLVDPITEIIPDGAAVSVIGSGQSNLALHGVIMDKNCLGFAMPMLDAPSDKPSSVQSSNGFSIRVVQGYDQTKKTETMSLDCLLGAQAYDPRRMTLLREY
jgi:hypothetical protein